MARNRVKSISRHGESRARHLDTGPPTPGDRPTAKSDHKSENNEDGIIFATPARPAGGPPAPAEPTPYILPLALPSGAADCPCLCLLLLIPGRGDYAWDGRARPAHRRRVPGDDRVRAAAL